MKAIGRILVVLAVTMLVGCRLGSVDVYAADKGIGWVDPTTDSGWFTCYDELDCAGTPG